MPEIIENVGFDDVLERVGAEGEDALIRYGALTCWWCHDHDVWYRTPPGMDPNRPSLPCDPRGGVLFEVRGEATREWLEACRDDAARYGRHGLRAFMAANHHNCVVALDDPRPTCMVTWDEYNDALDRLIGR